MNRRQLAKNTFLGLCGGLLGKKVEEPDVPANGLGVWSIMYTSGPDGKWQKCSEGVYSLADGSEIHSSTEPIPPGWDFLNDPEEDVYNG